MLRSIIKAALTTAMVICFAGQLPAQDSEAGKVGAGGVITGDFAEYFGQYNSGVEGEKAHFDNAGEAHLNFSAKKGKIMGFWQLEARDADSGTAVDASIRYAKYTSDALSVQIGTVANTGTVPFATKGGTKTTALKLEVVDGLVHGGYTEADGIRFGYQIDQLNLGLTMFSEASVLATGNKSGNTTQLDLSGKVANLGLRFAYTTETLDEYNDATPDTLSNSFMNLSVMVPFSETLSASIGYAASTIAVNDSINATNTNISLSVALKQAGPGNLTFAYETTDAATDGEKTGNTNRLNLVYDIPIDIGGFQVLYLSKTTKPEGGDAVTASFFGGGLYAKF